jgi:hypothetical protein
MVNRDSYGIKLDFQQTISKLLFFVNLYEFYIFELCLGKFPVVSFHKIMVVDDNLIKIFITEVYLIIPISKDTMMSVWINFKHLFIFHQFQVMLRIVSQDDISEFRV